ncbi:MAG: deoxynucleoside kinase [Candidatus Eisenbacteria sp.]|nr:deoxynucleoside kinase [Candidatus Eisenbacteria bacterium]
MDSSEFLVITGPIASGKSTIGFRVAELSDYEFFQEDVDSSPVDRDVLARYYRAVELFNNLKDRTDPISRKAVEEARRDVYDTQVHFIRKRSTILKRIAAEGIRAVIERHPWDDIRIFSRRNLNYGLLTAGQFDSLTELVRTEIEGIADPRVMVFLSAAPSNLRARIARRGREQERELLSPDNPYLEEIADLYEDWYADWTGRKFRVQTDGLSEEEVVSRIAQEFRNRGIVLTRPGRHLQPRFS